jgi:hypothetical protein
MSLLEKLARQAFDTARTQLPKLRESQPDGRLRLTASLRWKLYGLRRDWALPTRPRVPCPPHGRSFAKVSPTTPRL